MMIKKIDHIAFAVKSLGSSAKLFEKIFDVKSSKTEIIKNEKVKTKFLHLEKSKIELLEGIGKNSAITKFIEKKGEGIHHIAIEVDDIEKEIKRLKKEGLKPINDFISKGANNKLISFLHPKETNGVLIEICQKINK
tara:strand:+ start:2167 stop:2577 length:411 start_codon:yes stop_codon:yes gene_type:complete